MFLYCWICREGAENMYYFSSLALTLNEPEEGVAPTDSRRRPDQRLMEEGHWDEANAEKQRLEEKQRSTRREREREAVKAASSPEEGRTTESEFVFSMGLIFFFLFCLYLSYISVWCCVHSSFIHFCLSWCFLSFLFFYPPSSLNAKLSLRLRSMTRLWKASTQLSLFSPLVWTSDRTIKSAHTKCLCVQY